MTAALSSGDMTIFSMPIEAFEGDTFKKFTKRPGTVAVNLPISDMGWKGGVTIKSEDDNFRCPGTVGGEIVNVSMDLIPLKV